MRCHICDAQLTRVEIVRDPKERGGYKPCQVCVKASSTQKKYHEVIESFEENGDYLDALLLEQV